MNKKIINLAVIYANTQQNLYMQMHDKSPAEPERFYCEGAISALRGMAMFLNSIIDSIEENDK